jgi:hypothetical protein
VKPCHLTVQVLAWDFAKAAHVVVHTRSVPNARVDEAWAYPYRPGKDEFVSLVHLYLNGHLVHVEEVWRWSSPVRPVLIRKGKVTI